MNIATENLNLFIKMFNNSVKYFSRHVPLVNDLNVFPVPDGDTGTNMYQTLLGMQTRLSTTNPEDIIEYCDLLAQAALYEGRGNSGVILSQIYRGIAEGVQDCIRVDFDTLLNALTLARDFAYNSVLDPVEGTMLTVLTDLVDGLYDQKGKTISLCDSIKLLTNVAKISVDQTPDKLDVLKAGGVVDSGGYGLEIILRGMALTFNNSNPDEEPIYKRIPESSGDKIKDMISEHILGKEEYGYCTQFVLRTNIDLASQRNTFKKLGTSIVIAGNKDSFKIHLHSEDPGAIISLATDIGIISDVSIEDMESQSQNIIDDSIDQGFFVNEDLVATLSLDISNTILIVVASGIGVKNLFLELGSGIVINGGDTMNPSVSQILDAVNVIETDLILLLPNSKNVISAANEVAKLSDKNIVVLPTETVTEGIECAMSFDPSITPESNKEILMSLIEDIKTISIFSSSRAVVINGNNISKGQYIAMMNGEFLDTSDNPIDLLVNSIETVNESEREQVMVLVGDKYKNISLVEEKITDTFGELSSNGIEIHYGGQPNYDFLVSILN